jgi:nicotinamide riboside kinase
VADAPHRLALCIPIVGAESTGKTALAQALAGRIASLTGLRCTWVGEHLRAWCDDHGRTPRQHEQAGIAAAQQALIDAASVAHDVVVCDTTPLMTAVYSERIFGDRSLQPAAVAQQARYRLTLLTALDLDWEPDGLQRDGPHVREPVDDIIRRLLIGHALPWALVAGRGPARLESALDAVAPVLRRHLATAPAAGLFTRLADRDAAQPAWRGACDNCDAPDCEHLLLQQRARPAQNPPTGT